MPSFRQTSPTVSPLAKSRSASRSTRATSSAFRRFRIGPSVDGVYRGTNITPGPSFGEQTTAGVLPFRLSRQSITVLAPRIPRASSVVLFQPLALAQLVAERDRILPRDSLDRKVIRSFEMAG